MKKNKNLIAEIIIIVVVVVVLSFITFNQFSLAQAKSRDLQRRSDLHEFSKIIELYFADYGKFPSEELINGLWGKNWIDDGYVYTNSIPKEKKGEKEYCYQINEEGVSFKMFAEFENKNDYDCKEEGSFCNGIKYCYTDIVDVNKKTE